MMEFEQDLWITWSNLQFTRAIWGRLPRIMYRGNLLYFRLCLLPLVLLLVTTDKSLAPSSLQTPSSYLYTCRRYYLSLFFSRLNSPNNFCLSS